MYTPCSRVLHEGRSKWCTSMGRFKSGTAWGVQARIKDTLTLALGKRAY